MIGPIWIRLDSQIWFWIHRHLLFRVLFIFDQPEHHSGSLNFNMSNVETQEHLDGHHACSTTHSNLIELTRVNK